MGRGGVIPYLGSDRTTALAFLSDVVKRLHTAHRLRSTGTILAIPSFVGHICSLVSGWVLA